jgi:rod shape determining protein RodA
MLDKRLLSELDGLTIGLVLLLSLLGVVMIYSAAHVQSGAYHMRQLTWIGVSLAALFLIMLVDYKVLLGLALPFYVFVVAVLATLMVFARLVAGTKSWITMGGFRAQPSEIAKVALILVLARLFAEHRGTHIRWPRLITALVLAAAPIVLVVLQPDLGTALTFVPILLGALILAGLGRRTIIVSLVLAAAMAVGGWNFVLKDYQKKRLTTLVHPAADTRGAGYQILQSKIAIGSGGFLGKGFLRGSQSQLRFLPARHTDFVLSVVGEEFGFVGIAVVLGLYVLFLTRLFLVAGTARDRAGVYLVFMVALLLAFQFFINVLMIIGLFPVTGVPLPLLSYGGSSLVSTYLAVGLVLNIRMRRFANV